MLFRHSWLWRWIYEKSPLAGRRDLKIAGSGIGAMVMTLPRTRSVKPRDESLPVYALAPVEPMEALGLLAREGAVHYLDLQGDIVRVIKRFRETGRILTPRLEGIGVRDSLLEIGAGRRCHFFALSSFLKNSKSSASAAEWRSA